MDYGKTLNLPETEFPMRAGLPQREPDFLKFWEENDIYGKKQALHSRARRYAGIFIPRRPALENERDRGDITEHQAGPDRQRWAARRPWKGQRRKTEQQFPERSDCKARRH